MPAQTVVPVDFPTGSPRQLRSFIVTGDAPFLVDTGIPGSAEKILSAIAEAGLEPEDICIIVLTHAHPDHAGSVAELQEATGAPVIAHEIDAEALRDGRSEPVVGRTPQAQVFAEQIAARNAGQSGPAYEPVAPELVVTGDGHLDLDEQFGIHARLIHTPGHTAGGLTVLLGNGEAIVGDLLDRNAEGDPVLAGLAVDEAALTDSVARVLETQPPVVHTCHGGSFTREELVAALGG